MFRSVRLFEIFRSETSAEAPQDSEFLSLLRISEFFGFQWQTFGRNSDRFAECLADVAITRLFVANVVISRFFVANVAIARFLGCNFTQNFGRKVQKYRHYF